MYPDLCSARERYARQLQQLSERRSAPLLRWACKTLTAAIARAACGALASRHRSWRLRRRSQSGRSCPDV